MAYDIGGGGLPPGSISENTKIALSKPFDLEGEMSPAKMAQLDQMLAELYAATVNTEDRVVSIEEEPDAEAEAQVVLQRTVPLTYVVCATVAPKRPA